jgi:SIR2-like protein
MGSDDEKKSSCPTIHGCSESEFVTRLKDEIRKGISLVPFIGSGLSASSGILTGIEFANYLTTTVLLCVAGEKCIPGSTERDPNTRRDLHRQGWPRFPNDDQVKQAIKWVKQSKTKLQKPDAKNTRVPKSEQKILREALESLQDWRSTLEFLARLQHLQNADRSKLLLGEIDQSIVDKFNLHITRGRRPNFGHSMLCHLAGPAHIRTVLTTNFDTLIEDAFAHLNLRFEVISVGIKDPLPHPDTVHSLNCIVKLHGAIKDTRADHSLDQMPTYDDRRRFCSYVIGGDWFLDGARFRPGHLLVIGYSGKDRRCIEMIKFVLERDQESQVFWVCFKEADQKALLKIFPKKLHHRVISVLSSHPDLLLYQLYQEVTLALPGSGFTYQLSPNMPFGIDENQYGVPDQEIADDAAEILEKIKNIKPGDPIGYVTVDGQSGIATPLRTAFNEATQSLVRTAIWLELEDYFDIASLAHEILQIIAVRIGRFQLDHEVFVPTGLSILDESGWRKHCKLLFETWGFKPESWLIVLYARNGYGGCVGWSQNYWPESEGEMTSFVKLLAALGFRVVYAPYSDERFERDWQKERIIHTYANALRGRAKPEKLARAYFEEEFAAKENAKNEERDGFPDSGAEYRISKGSFMRSSGTPLFKVEHLGKPGKGYFKCQSHQKQGFEKILKALLSGWIESSQTEATNSQEEPNPYDRQVFLYGCTLFRQSRHYAAFFIDAVMECPLRYNTKGLDNDRERFTRLRVFLKNLYDIGMFHQKPGGFAWMYRDLRLGVRHLLESIEPSIGRSESGGFRKIGRFRQIRAFAHYSIADWYTKAFHSTGHPLPLLEALHHYVQCAIFAPEAARLADENDEKQKSPPNTDSEVTKLRIQYRRGLWKVAVQRLIKNLRLGRPVLKLWLEEPIAVRWFGFYQENGASERTKAGGEELLALLEKSMRGLEPRPMNDDSTKMNGLRETFINEGREASACWDELKPLLIHELVSIVSEIRDVPVYSTPQGRATTDPLLSGWLSKWDDGRGRGAEGYRMDFDEALYVSGDRGWHTHILTQLRQLRVVCEGGLGKFFEELIRFVELLFKEGDVFIVDRDLDNACRDFLLTVSVIGDDLTELPVSLVEIIGRLAHAWIRRARLQERVIAGLRDFPASRERDENNSRRLWAQASALCRMVIDLCAHLHPSHLQAELAVREKFSTLYGLALGRLDRFFEAHRRLNEAGAILSNSNLVRNDSVLPTRKLRRSEVHILEARLIGEIARYFARWELDWILKTRGENGKKECWEECRRAFVENDSPERRRAREEWLDLYLGPPSAKSDNRESSGDFSNGADEEGPVNRLLRLHIAKLDAAWLALEDAERLLSGKSQSSLYWLRLRELQLQVFAEHRFLDPSWPGDLDGSKNAGSEIPPNDHPCKRFRTLAFRLQRSYGPYICELFRQGLATAPGDLYRSLRILDAFLPAHRNATYADEMLREPANLAGAAATHQENVVNLLKTTLEQCCPLLVESFDRHNVNTDLLDKYCIRVDKAYKDAGCSIVGLNQQGSQHLRPHLKNQET